MRRKIELLILVFCCVASSLFAADRLAFHKNGKLKICQFTDMHWDAKSPNCSKTRATIVSILQKEKPDVAILTGDIVTEKPGLEGWKSVIEIFEKEKMPFVVTMGNHDAEVLPRNEIYNLLLKSPYYVGEKGPSEISGMGNCVVPIYLENRVAALLYCLDSNDYQPYKIYGEYDWIHHNQIDWYRAQSEKYRNANGGKPIPALAFFHIPLQEYKEILGGVETMGIHNEDAIYCSKINSGMFSAFVDMKDVMGVFVGHDHDDDFIGINMGIALGYGRVTGADAYGDLVRGARIIELHANKSKFDTWIATPEENEATFYFPSGLNSQEESSMTYLKATKNTSKKRGVAYKYYEGKCKSVADIPHCKLISEGIMPSISIANAKVDDYFAYQFSTLIYIAERGVYRFYTYSDDGSILYIDGQKIVDNDGGHSAKRVDGKVALERGFHHLQVDYFESYMGQELEIGYTSKNVPETILKTSDFYLP